MLPGQVGSATSYVTPEGTQAYQRSVYLDDAVQDDSTAAMVWLPGNPTFAVEQTPWVVYFHGATANEQQLLITGNLLNPWLDLGWAVLSLRLGTTGVVSPTVDNNDGKWGNNWMRDGAQFADTWIEQFATLPERGLLLYASSAGGTNSLNTVLEWTYRRGVDHVPVAGLVAVDPALNLRYSYDKGGIGITGTPGTNGSSGNIRGQIKAAYEIPNNTQSGESAWTTRVDDPRNGHDIAEMIDVADIGSFPILLSASSDDSLIKKSKNTDLFAPRLLADGRWTTTGETNKLELLLITTGGAHGASNHFDPDVHNPFLQRCLER